MGTDIRISTAFLDHPKTVKLERRLGVQGIKSLLALWLWCRISKPCGRLSGMDSEDIEIAARWTGEPGLFVNECVTLRWLDVNESLTASNAVEYAIHDWAEHNSWAVGSDERSNASRFSRMAMTHPELYEKLKTEGKKSITSEEFQKLTKNNESLTNVKASLTPSPSPSPSPSPREYTRPDFISEKSWEDLLLHRKKKKASMTERAINSVSSEIGKAISLGFTADQCIDEIANRSWTGFKAEWMVNNKVKPEKEEW